MREYIAMDVHKHYSLLEKEDVATGQAHQQRIEHERGAIRLALEGVEPGTPVAVEATGNWYWIVQEIEEANLLPKLVHPRKAKLMMGMINKTDRLDVHGLNRLQRNDVLPTVWIPPGDLRDLRELTRTRIALGQKRTWLKNKIRSTLSKHGLQIKKYSDPFGRRGREELTKRVQELPEQTRYVTELLVQQLDFITDQIKGLEGRIQALVKITPQMELLMSLPGIGVILSAVIMLEIGDIERFPWAGHLAAYAGTTPRVHSSGGKTRYGRLRPDVDRYLQWAFVEAGNSVCVNYRRRPDKHVSQLYRRVKQRRGHHQAIGAVARHLAESAFHVLTREEPYRDPVLARKGDPGRCKRESVMSS